MKLNLVKRLLIVLVAMSAKLSLASPLPNNDFQFWGNYTLKGPISGKFRYWLEQQARFGDDASRLSQFLYRPGIGYVLNETSSIWVGYAYIDTQFPFSSQGVGENRIWQQFSWAKSNQWGRLSSRTRLEQRFIDSVSQTGWRFRQAARIQRPFSGKWFVAVTDEIFWRLNNTQQQGSNSGFDQNRLFASVGCLPNEKVLMEVGLLNQTIRRIASQNYSGNYLAANLIVNL